MKDIEPSSPIQEEGIKDMEPSSPIQEQGMKDMELSLSIQEQWHFIDINKQVNQKLDQEQEDAEPPCPPAGNKTALQVDLESGKRWKRKKRRKRKQKKAHQTPSTFTKRECEWKDFFWTSLIIVCLSTLLVSGTAAISMQERSVEEVPKIQAQKSEDPTYKSAGKDMCTAICKVDDPPIVLNLNENSKLLRTDIRCPDTEEYLKIETCFQNDSLLKLSFKKGEAGSLFIEHGTGRDHSIYVDMKNKACYSSVEDQAATPTPKPVEPQNEATKGCPSSVKDCLVTKRQNVNDLSNFSTKFTGVGGMNIFGGKGALILIIFPLGALIFVVKYSRHVGRAVASNNNGDVGGQV
ncbi:uncharacterized protein LOC143933529 [Lithobates pipiens]